MKINITDKYNQQHTFNLFPTDNQITVRELYESCLKTAENERVEKDSIGFQVLLECMKGFIKARIPNLERSFQFYSENA